MKRSLIGDSLRVVNTHVMKGGHPPSGAAQDVQCGEARADPMCCSDWPVLLVQVGIHHCFLLEDI